MRSIGIHTRVVGAGAARVDGVILGGGAGAGHLSVVSRERRWLRGAPVGLTCFEGIIHVGRAPKGLNVRQARMPHGSSGCWVGHVATQHLLACAEPLPSIVVKATSFSSREITQLVTDWPDSTVSLFAAQRRRCVGH